MNRRAHVEADIINQRKIRDTAIAAITNLETRLENVTEAKNSAALNPAAKLEEQVTSARALRNFSMTMLKLYMQREKNWRTKNSMNRRRLLPHHEAPC